ncbi:hypothetical protein GPUN_1446 [Glaciecola punicea ACAM 611]|uniref:Uncharacterized protein n=1 Tax=Glaciecola punicea ACAM 611 TaxID=1121923 RepID=H5TB93_9ALTE|nr:hypothetical protein GPUN_1446 [Glaciecola punicea ACAM 611]
MVVNYTELFPLIKALANAMIALDTACNNLFTFIMSSVRQ